VAGRMSRLVTFSGLAYSNPSEVTFGSARRVLRYGLGLEVGRGRVVPEIKYFPKPSDVSDASRLLAAYKRMTERILDRAAGLGVRDLQLETELPHVATLSPKLAGEVVLAQRELMERAHEEYGIRLALRVTVADIRDFRSPEAKEERTSVMMETFSEVSSQGADVVSIESFGGKEVFSQAIIRCDVRGMIFATGLLGSRDVEDLWSEIRRAVRGSTLLGGDSACAHANSAMVLANGLHKRMVPHVVASMARVLGAVRTLVCYECGAQGPGKDCAYENVYIKLITGVPVSMEGKSSACAHSSLVGNIVASVCDLWSNESIEDVRLYGGRGPEVFLEILHYDCELMNKSIELGYRDALRRALIECDRLKDPQGLVLAPDVAFEISKAIVSTPDYYERSVMALRKACEIMEASAPSMALPEPELRYLRRARRELERLPGEGELIEEMVKKYSRLVPSFNPKSYDV